ncbi:hypothetical protein DSO57_1015992 [Entomophthora muscae]|uniref:Uncharacterized protein n=1 Tax=Entomophthora muscae TaxID=34485 RepID=A0ACC2STP9_9FUNG|nr:hypothetical protein DSO57_1015992 [Entomophthora muscae]
MLSLKILVFIFYSNVSPSVVGRLSSSYQSTTPKSLVRAILDHVPYVTIAYCNAKKRLEEIQNPQILKKSIDFISAFGSSSTEVNVILYTDSANKEIIATFRGSDDFVFFRQESYFNVPGAYVASTSTFFKAVQDHLVFQINFLKKEHPTYCLTLVGHSLGGILATLAAPTLSKRLGILPRDIHIITYGQPKVGNKAFADYYSSLGFNITRVVNKDDMVPSYPAQPNWYHVHPQVRINQDNQFSSCWSKNSNHRRPSLAEMKKYLFLSDHVHVAGRKISQPGCTYEKFN